MRPWILYSLARLGLFAGVLAVLLLLRLEWWIAAIAAAVIALCVSYIFLGGLRTRAAEQLATVRTPRPTRDDDAEDAELAASEMRSATGPGDDAADR